MDQFEWFKAALHFEPGIHKPLAQVKAGASDGNPIKFSFG